MNLIYFSFDPTTMLIHVTLSSTGYVEKCVFIWLVHHITFGLIHSMFTMYPRRNAGGL
ncbi:hypothetical protein Hdeb2414_s0388g00883291 [Helianthus debilis subsp. tardiflorus]